MSNRFRGKRVVVVGGGQAPGATIGNGRAVAELFAREGAELLVVDRSLDAAEETVEAVRASGGRAHAFQADISREADCIAVGAAAYDVLGDVDILHNNVGIAVVKSTEETSLSEWQHGYAVNLTGMWLVTKQFLPHMRERRAGCVINISSSAASMTSAIVYTMTKRGVNDLTRGLALEYAAHNVRVNAIAPGMMDTPMGVDRVAGPDASRRVEIAAQRAAMVPMKRQGDAWDVARLAAFLASDEASYITGAVVPVDGASSLLMGGGANR